MEAFLPMSVCEKDLQKFKRHSWRRPLQQRYHSDPTCGCLGLARARDQSGRVMGQLRTDCNYHRGNLTTLEPEVVN